MGLDLCSATSTHLAEGHNNVHGYYVGGRSKAYKLFVCTTQGSRTIVRGASRTSSSAPQSTNSFSSRHTLLPFATFKSRPRTSTGNPRARNFDSAEMTASPSATAASPASTPNSVQELRAALRRTLLDDSRPVPHPIPSHLLCPYPELVVYLYHGKRECTGSKDAEGVCPGVRILAEVSAANPSADTSTPGASAMRMGMGGCTSGSGRGRGTEVGSVFRLFSFLLSGRCGGEEAERSWARGQEGRGAARRIIERFDFALGRVVLGSASTWQKTATVVLGWRAQAWKASSSHAFCACFPFSASCATFPFLFPPRVPSPFVPTLSSFPLRPVVLSSVGTDGWAASTNAPGRFVYNAWGDANPLSVRSLDSYRMHPAAGQCRQNKEHGASAGANAKASSSSPTSSYSSSSPFPLRTAPSPPRARTPHAHPHSHFHLPFATRPPTPITPHVRRRLALLQRLWYQQQRGECLRTLAVL
ncbi:hypothetical protein B0H14DRAFT_3474692 [Mycena olivaceomarginata]|nr:hypothetical protein B0H14DRAFT_3474692 [Mycena olivaceomarginata]